MILGKHMLQAELEHRIKTHDMRTNIICCHRGSHHGYHQSGRKSFVDFLKREHHPRQRGMECRRQSRAGSTSHQISFLGLPPVQEP